MSARVLVDLLLISLTRETGVDVNFKYVLCIPKVLYSVSFHLWLCRSHWARGLLLFIAFC